LLVRGRNGLPRLRLLLADDLRASVLDGGLNLGDGFPMRPGEPAGFRHDGALDVTLHLACLRPQALLSQLRLVGDPRSLSGDRPLECLDGGTGRRIAIPLGELGNGTVSGSSL